MKKVSLFLVVMIIISIVSVLPVSAVTFTPTDEIYSDSAYMINLDTHTVIYEKNPQKKEFLLKEVTT